METDGSASREAVSGHDTPSSVSSSARRHCQCRSFAQLAQWRREGQHHSVSHLCSPRPASHGILRAQSNLTVTGLAQCCLTLRSSGAPTAKCQARSGGTRYIVASPGLAFCCRRPLSSNVRPHSEPIVDRRSPEQPRRPCHTLQGPRTLPKKMSSSTGLRRAIWALPVKITPCKNTLGLHNKNTLTDLRPTEPLTNLQPIAVSSSTTHGI